jgi:hypothetical protein
MADILIHNEGEIEELTAMNETGMRAMNQCNPQRLSIVKAAELVRTAKLEYGAVVERW